MSSYQNPVLVIRKIHFGEKIFFRGLEPEHSLDPDILQHISSSQPIRTGAATLPLKTTSQSIPAKIILYTTLTALLSLWTKLTRAHRQCLCKLFIVLSMQP